MATKANISGWKFSIVNNNSPEVLTALEEVRTVSNVGKTNTLVDATNFDSPAGTREYIAGLADGDEVTIECNYIPAAVMQGVAIGAVDNRQTRQCRLTYTVSSPERRFTFNGVFLGYSIAPSSTEINTITFTVKISGNVSRV
jgi:hypothetical protein